MKKCYIVLFSFCAFMSTGDTFAQSKVKKPNTIGDKDGKELPKALPKIKSIPVYLGSSSYSDGLIPKNLFDSLALQGLHAKDSNGVEGKIKQFRLYYKERNLYEDSSGNYMLMVDLLTDLSMSNQLNNYVANSLKERTKKGDTAFFDDIFIKMPDSTDRIGKPMKFIIDK